MILTSFDNAMHVFAQGHPNIVLWTAITLLGDTLTLAAVVMLLIYLYREKKARLMLLISLLSAIVVSGILKYLFGRVRPEDAALTTPSFPSGHTLAATAVWGMFAYLLWSRGRRWQAGAIIIIPVAVGISRIMLSQHWATDVIGGWLLGAMLITVIVLATAWMHEHEVRI
jgi:membrane-associated phospholipid phosphatase